MAKFSKYNGKINSHRSVLSNSAEEYIEFHSNISDNYHIVLMVEYNHSIEDLIEKLTKRIEMMRTRYLARINLDLSWK